MLLGSAPAQAFAPFGWWESLGGGWIFNLTDLHVLISHHHHTLGEAADYWPGAPPGSRECSCARAGTCSQVNSANIIFVWADFAFPCFRYVNVPTTQAGLVCNCDSGDSDWQEDGGNITEPKHLPVAALHFGDTGNPFDQKEGRWDRILILKCRRKKKNIVCRFLLGPLTCSGDR